MDLKLPIQIIDEMEDSLVKSTGMLDLASGEIRNVQYDDYDVGLQGVPAETQGYDFTMGVLSDGKREVEFRIDVDAVAGTYSVSPNELLELKGRAAKLFTQRPS